MTGKMRILALIFKIIMEGGLSYFKNSWELVELQCHKNFFFLIRNSTGKAQSSNSASAEVSQELFLQIVITRLLD